MDIVLSTLNAKYIHASMGLRCLRANLGPWRTSSSIREFTISHRPIDIVETLLSEAPKVIALGVYIWNARESLEVVRLLKQLAPSVCVVLGGPEVSHELEKQELVALADHVITGEGEAAFFATVDALMKNQPVSHKVIAGGLPDLKQLVLPYDEYTDDDVKHRVVYVEASRGCPFSCEFCLSSLDEKVRTFPLENILAALERLTERGVKQFKFVDRTFNLSPRVSHALLDFFLARQGQGLFAHFEMIPGRFPEALRERIARFEPGAIQLEVGVQTFDIETARRISRTQINEAIDTNLKWLAEHTGAHVHADLIVGLPGEDIESFGRGFDRLLASGPHEIQVGILKRLKGTPIIRHDREFECIWNHEPPFEIVQNRLIPFAQMQQLKRFARVWDLMANRGNFSHSISLLWESKGSAFESVFELSEWLALRASLGGVALARLAELFLEFLVEVQHRDREMVGRRLARDFEMAGKHVPMVLQPFVKLNHAERKAESGLPTRQAKHLHRAVTATL